MTRAEWTDLEPVIPIAYGSTEIVETGKWGYQKPEDRTFTAPCQEACPAGNPIARFLYQATQKRYEEALLSLLRENPLPGTCGRVCFHPCEGDCNRSHFDEPVSVHALERYVFDVTSRLSPRLDPIDHPNPQPVAVVGGGPCGLSAAYFLTLLGHRVTLFEATKDLGGMMQWGIPDYRLPKGVLRKEIKRILALGIEVQRGVRVGKEISFQGLGNFKAVFLSPGAGLSRSLSIGEEEIHGIWKGLDFLRQIHSGKKVRLGKEIVVLGGGNTALDAARVARRFGSRVVVIYRRTKAEMPAFEEELQEAEEEGIGFEFLLQPVKMELVGRRRVRITFQRMKLGRRDQTGRRRAIPVDGSFVTREADGVVVAVGDDVDGSSIPPGLMEKGTIGVDAYLRTNRMPFFAGGDAVDQPRTVVTAIAAGKRGALSIDLYLRGLSPETVFPRIAVGRKGALSLEAYRVGIETGRFPERGEVVLHDRLHSLFFQPSKRITPRRRIAEDALSGFREVRLGLSHKEAEVSARRCFSCGTCNYCLNCYFFCPEGVIALDPVAEMKRVDLVHCKGCGTCAQSCPRSAIRMRENV